MTDDHKTTNWQPLREVGDRSRFEVMNPVLIGWMDGSIPSYVVAYWEGDKPDFLGRGWIDCWSGHEIEGEPDAFMVIPKLQERQP